jgi:hypothetical protein
MDASLRRQGCQLADVGVDKTHFYFTLNFVLVVVAKLKQHCKAADYYLLVIGIMFGHCQGGQK